MGITCNHLLYWPSEMQQNGHFLQFINVMMNSQRFVPFVDLFDLDYIITSSADIHGFLFGLSVLSCSLEKSFTL
jgi:hypothetical protein